MFCYTIEVTVPVEKGMPCGVQFIGCYGKETFLIRLAARLEIAQPRFDKLPPAES